MQSVYAKKRQVFYVYLVGIIVGGNGNQFESSQEMERAQGF